MKTAKTRVLMLAPPPILLASTGALLPGEGQGGSGVTTLLNTDTCRWSGSSLTVICQSMQCDDENCTECSGYDPPRRCSRQLQLQCGDMRGVYYDYGRVMAG